MKKDYIYLDNAATTPVDPRVIEVINKHLKDNYGNASSLHSLGLNAHRVLEESRETVGVLINAQKEDIIFTGSGTEADNIAINGVAFANKNRGNHIITSSIEHHAALNPCKELEKQGFKVSYLPVDKFGLIDIENLKESITDKTILISIAFANNEIGTIQPIREIGEIASDSNLIFHTDAVQVFGKIPIDVKELKFDLLSASAHKLYGPKGVGMLFMRNKGKKEGWGKYCKP
ncbi:MAG: cysteine desulfurase, partial [Candidatus Lokiarchaeota archaeon]|nr:cysteine desulfurase [Candidatus Lokiarchaeota archaeon]